MDHINRTGLYGRYNFQQFEPSVAKGKEASEFECELPLVWQFEFIWRSKQS